MITMSHAFATEAGIGRAHSNGRGGIGWNPANSIRVKIPIPDVGAVGLKDSPLEHRAGIPLAQG